MLQMRRLIRVIETATPPGAVGAISRLREYIETQEIRRSASAAILHVFETGWRTGFSTNDGTVSGAVLDALRAALEPLLQAAFTGRLHRRLLVTIHLVDDPDGLLTNAGAGIRDFGHTVMFQLGVPRSWLSGSAIELPSKMRQNGALWAAQLSRAVAHEALHLEQTLRSEASVADRDPASLNHRARVRSRAITGAAMAGSRLRYLGGKDEVDAQALSAALELVDALGDPAQALALLTRPHVAHFLRLASDPFVAPHLHDYWQQARSRPEGKPIWRAFLRALAKHLRQYADLRQPIQAAP